MVELKTAAIVFKPAIFQLKIAAIVFQTRTLAPLTPYPIPYTPYPISSTDHPQLLPTSEIQRVPGLLLLGVAKAIEGSG